MTSASSISDAVAMCTAAFTGDCEQLKQLVWVRGVSVDCGDYDQRTAIHLAASEGKLSVVRFLVEQLGAAISPADRYGGTPLDDSIRHRHYGVETYLRSRNAAGGKTHANAAASVACTLCEAAANGSRRELRRLVRSEFFNINAGDYDKRCVYLGEAVQLVWLTSRCVCSTRQDGPAPCSKRGPPASGQAHRRGAGRSAIAGRSVGWHSSGRRTSRAPRACRALPTM